MERPGLIVISTTLLNRSNPRVDTEPMQNYFRIDANEVRSLPGEDMSCDGGVRDETHQLQPLQSAGPREDAFHFIPAPFPESILGVSKAAGKTPEGRTIDRQAPCRFNHPPGGRVLEPMVFKMKAILHLSHPRSETQKERAVVRAEPW